jgi:hypothetical protein
MATGAVMANCISRALLGVAILAAAGASSAALAQSGKKSRAQSVTLQSTEKELRRSVFSGNEVRLGVLWGVEANCEGTPLADVRVFKQPANGDLSFRETSSVVELKKESARAHCNGRPINGVAVFYKSREDFTGTERMEIEVDYKIGLIRRYSLIVSVR